MNIPWAFRKKKVYFVAVGWSVLYMSIRYLWFIELFSSSTPVLIFCLVVLSVAKSKEVEVPTLIVSISISPFSAIIF